MKDFFTTEIRYDEAREGPDFTCDACAEVRCATCDHEPCPVCIDSCDHTECTTWNDKGKGTSSHECQFTACSRLHSPEPLEYEARKARALNLTPRGMTPIHQRVFDACLEGCRNPEIMLNLAKIWELYGMEEAAETLRIKARSLKTIIRNITQ